MSEKPDVLYDGNERASYCSIESVKNMLIVIDAFYAYRNSFGVGEGDADIVLEYIVRIRDSIPNEIRGIFPDHFELSNKSLGKLEEKCKKVLREEAPA